MKLKDEMCDGVSVCRNKGTQSDLGTSFLPAPPAGGYGDPSSGSAPKLLRPPLAMVIVSYR